MEIQQKIRTPIDGMPPAAKAVAHLMRAAYRLAMFGRKPQTKVPDVPPAKEVHPAQFTASKPEEGQAIYCHATTTVAEASSRIVVVPITAAKGLQIGRIWLYLYEREGYIRRVFRVEDDQIRSLLGCKRAYYMTNLKWDVAGGAREIERIRLVAAKDVERLIVATHELRAKQSGRKGVACEHKGAVKIAPDVIPVPRPLMAVSKAEATAGSQSATTTCETPSSAAVGAVSRPIEGKTYEGVIAEMGHTTRQGDDGPYQAFCVKVETQGIHHPLYGVELEREIIERRAMPGDTVRITHMNRQPISGRGRTMWKNLYKVEVLKRKAAR